MKGTLSEWWTKPFSPRVMVNLAAVGFFALGFLTAKLYYADHASWLSILERFVGVGVFVALIQGGRVLIARTKPS
jgi:hypothetical protein